MNGNSTLLTATRVSLDILFVAPENLHYFIVLQRNPIIARSRACEKKNTKPLAVSPVGFIIILVLPFKDLENSVLLLQQSLQICWDYYRTSTSTLSRRRIFTHSHVIPTYIFTSRSFETILLVLVKTLLVLKQPRWYDISAPFLHYIL